MKYTWNVFATLPHEMGPPRPTKENTQLIRQMTFLWNKSD